MKHFFRTTFILLFLCSSQLGLFAQDKIHWSFGVSEGFVYAKAKLDEGWYIYSMDLDENIGPVPTEVVFEPGDNYQLHGNVTESPTIEKEDKAFGVVIPIHLAQVTFKQAIEYNGLPTISGNILYMMCDEHGCLPPEYFTFNIEIEE
ncbi:MAG: hypothetical protein JJT77_08470 [Crocinitomicaceae bacterium]|jgi:thiol:disulfide interchange protein DsbD|nr:hypothetical protein [Crocinitomicaceae bacterium]